MAWVALILSLAVLWFASLCKILHGSSSAMKAAFLNEGNFTVGLLKGEMSYWLLRIPTMSLCNADRMGSIRKEELYLACAVLKIPTQQVNILDHPDLQDGFGKAWDWNLLASIIDNEIHTCSIDLIITFDDYGISGHCNHRDVHQGVRKLLHDVSGRHLEAWELVPETFCGVFKLYLC
ncbi:n-acetylglucosaminyl-phosphatidylinositol de-n-acetylase [Phtheirospermum japonicum]|uniref:N-acetylglucosaminylphosphatidylinositol deacetylase n=1 Tax=Phtheirospermum japonicum TaxID=374723 RepID=A0A830C5T0_9LAMI|nr:n-acetylglucosaminyl-phosphatidylinositol de-n-acetylase [Phtheirospermum japonicum]